VLKYNQRVYDEARARHTLTQRYQLCENVRASRQLMPTIMLHTLHSVYFPISVTLFYFCCTPYDDVTIYFSLPGFVITSAVYMFIQLALLL